MYQLNAQSLISLVFVAVTSAACSSPMVEGDNDSPDEQETGLDYLGDACLYELESIVADGMRRDIDPTDPNGGILTDNQSTYLRLLDPPSACERLQPEESVGSRTESALRLLDVLEAQTLPDDEDALRDLATVREFGGHAASIAEVLVYDAVVRLLEPDPDPTAETLHVDRLSLAVWLVFGIDSGPHPRLDDPQLIQLLIPVLPELDELLASTPEEMVGITTLLAVIRYVVADLHRVARCGIDGPIRQRLFDLLGLFATHEQAERGSSETLDYFERNLDHFEQRCR